MKRLRVITAYVVLTIGSLVHLATIVDAGVRCNVSTGLSSDGEMKFCLRTDIFISAVGQITDSTPGDFERFLREAVAAGIRPHSVTFHSPGGSVGGAIALGRMIRALKLDTHVGQSSWCSSACELAFIGGWSRKITHDGRIGNHQIRDITSDVGRIEEIQDMIGFLSDYHREMNVSPLAVNAAMTRRSHEMYWYSREEQQEWGIVTKR